MLEREEIKKVIPHREPFLLLDKILEFEPGKRALGLKKVSLNEPFFEGHFPDYPLMPGVLIVEALAQTGAFALLASKENQGKRVLFAGIDNFRFKREVHPGDELKLELEVLKAKGLLGVGKGTAYVSGEIVAQGELKFALK